MYLSENKACRHLKIGLSIISCVIVLWGCVRAICTKKPKQKYLLVGRDILNNTNGSGPNWKTLFIKLISVVGYATVTKWVKGQIFGAYSSAARLDFPSLSPPASQHTLHSVGSCTSTVCFFTAVACQTQTSQLQYRDWQAFGDTSLPSRGWGWNCSPAEGTVQKTQTFPFSHRGTRAHTQITINISNRQVRLV